MPPQQYNNNNRYDFIINGGQKKSLLPSLKGSDSFTKKLIFIIGGAVILIIVMWIVGSLLGGGGSSAGLAKIVQQEEEIARVAAEGSKANRSDIKSSAVNIQLTMDSQQREWQLFLAERGSQVGEKELVLLKNPATDQQLTTAHSNNAFDKTFVDVMRTFLNDYSNTLQTTFTSSSNEAERALLKTHFDQTQLLIEQLPKI